jgi:acetyl-CoA carboxylase biotin carboxyl carrier protein
MKEVIALMAGIVVQVKVEQGEEICAGQEVFTLESMKMEVPITSISEGKVAKVKVNLGDFVNEGDVLAVLE